MTQTLPSQMLAAVIQLNPGADICANLQKAAGLIAEAAAAGAELVALQETFYYSGPHEPEDMQRVAETLPGPVSQWLADQARQQGIWLLGGSIFEANPADPARAFNTAQVFDPQGQCQARYRKSHLFELKDDKHYSESRYQCPGPMEPVVAKTPWGGLGLSICYDLRFPQLYQQLVRQLAATMIAVPSAFLQRTGEAHWHALLRARAIETQCFVLAPNAWRQSDPATFGHSLIIDPWGRVLAEQTTGEGLILASLDFELLADVRRRLPVLELPF